MTAKILITRPTESAGEFAKQLRASLGQDVPLILSPLIRVKHLAPEIHLSNVQTLIFTSAHAVRAFAALSPERRFTCYVVGSSTGYAARRAGFEPIEGGGTAESLAEKIRKDRPAGTWLYLRGKHIAFDLKGALADLGPGLVESVVYEQCATALTADAKRALSNSSAVVLPLFSPRSAKLFFDGQAWKGDLFVGALSENIATVVPKSGVTTLMVADTPTSGAMLNLTEKLWRVANRLEGNSSAQ